MRTELLTSKLTQELYDAAKERALADTNGGLRSMKFLPKLEEHLITLLEEDGMVEINREKLRGALQATADYGEYSLRKDPVEFLCMPMPAVQQLRRELGRSMTLREIPAVTPEQEVEFLSKLSDSK